MCPQRRSTSDFATRWPPDSGPFEWEPPRCALGSKDGAQLRLWWLLRTNFPWIDWVFAGLRSTATCAGDVDQSWLYIHPGWPYLPGGGPPISTHSTCWRHQQLWPGYQAFHEFCMMTSSDYNYQNAFRCNFWYADLCHARAILHKRKKYWIQ